MRAIPSVWAQVTLGDLTEYVTSGSRDWSKYYAEKGALFVRTQDINTNKLGDLDSIAKVRLPSSVEGKRTLIRKDDLLVTITGANVGRCAHVVAELPEAYVSQSIALIRLLDPSLGRFVHLQLLSPIEKSGKSSLEARAYGMGRPVLNLDNIRETPILIPPRHEQKRIADKLDAVLTRVEAVNSRLVRVAPIIKRFRQSVLAAATSGRLTEDWREAAQTLAAWGRTTVGAISADLRYGTSKKCSSEPVGNAVLRIPNIGGHGRPELSDLKYAEFDSAEQAKLALRVGDLLIIRSNGSVDLVGKCCVVNEQAAGMLFAGYLMRLRVDSARALPEFILLALSSPLIRGLIEQTAKSTSGVNNINSEELRSLPLHLPPLEEQAEIVRHVETLFAYADRLEARLRTAQTAAERSTPALLAKAFRGELVPQDPNDEPASELLRRLHQGAPSTGTKRRRKTVA